MTEHAHKAEEHHECAHKACMGKPMRILSASILIGAILVSASIFYNTKILLTKVDGLSLSSGTQAVNDIQQNNQDNKQAALPPDNGAPVKVQDRSDQPVIGNSNAKLALYEFSDFQCPYCEKFYKDTLSQIKKNFIDTGKVKLVYRHFPLPFHQNAQKAAEAAECANRQGKFSQYHDLLFNNSQPDGKGLAIEDLKKYADQLGLNKGILGFKKDQFNQCLDNGEAAATVKKDADAASSVGISGTPSFVLNGKKIVGAQPYSVFEQAINDALKK